MTLFQYPYHITIIPYRLSLILYPFSIISFSLSRNSFSLIPHSLSPIDYPLLFPIPFPLSFILYSLSCIAYPLSHITYPLSLIPWGPYGTLKGSRLWRISWGAKCPLWLCEFVEYWVAYTPTNFKSTFPGGWNNKIRIKTISFSWLILAVLEVTAFEIRNLVGHNLSEMGKLLSKKSEWFS